MRKKTIKLPALFFLILIVSLGLVIIFLGGFGKKAPARLDPIAGQGRILFAHRGVADGFPENSREAIVRAKQLGFTALEVDVRRTADGEFVLFHDGDGRRLLGIETNLTDMTLAELKTHRLLSNGSASGSEVMTLKELLDEFGKDFLFYFDLKLKHRKDAEDLAHLMEQCRISDNAILASASPWVIMSVEYRHPGIMTALEGLNSGKEWMYSIIPKKLKPDFLSGFSSRVDQQHMDWLRAHGLLSSRIVYGVDSTNYQKVTSLGIRNMIIDYFPGLDKD